MVTKSILTQLKHESPNVRSKAVMSLIKTPSSQAIEILVHIVCTDDDLNVQEDATWAITRIGEAASSALIEKLNDPDPNIRHNATHTLGKLGSVQAVPMLIHILSDPDDRVRQKAAFVLGQIGDARAINPLIQCLDDTSLEVCVAARDALEKFSGDALGLLIQALENGSDAIREQACETLGQMGKQEATVPLIHALNDPIWKVRFAAVHGLGQIKDKKAIEHVQTMFHDPDKRVQQIAARIIQQSIHWD